MPGRLFLLFVLAAIQTSNAQFALPSQFKIITKDQNFTGSLADGDLFGISLTRIGDFNGDGVEDIAVGASSTDDDGPLTGAVWILLLNEDNSVKDQYKISNTSGGFSGGVAGNSRFGYSVANIGDLDGDGTVDLAVGAVYDADGGYQHGALWILFLSKNGTVKASQKINEVSGGLSATLPDLASFGSSVAAIGDLDGDGVTELAVGAYRDNGQTTKSGAVYILFLNASGMVKATKKISGGISGLPSFLGVEDYFGCAVAEVGDLDGDGLSELVVGNQRDDDGGSETGSIFILYLNADGSVKRYKKITENSSGFNFDLTTGELFGSSISVLRDIDDIGSIGFIVGSTRENSGGADAGAVWVFETNSDLEVQKAEKLNYGQGGVGIDIAPNSRFGQSVLAYKKPTGDYNFIIGAPYYIVDQSTVGGVWVVGSQSCELTANADAGDNQTLCNAHSASLNASLSAGQEGFWSTEGAAVVADLADPGSVVTNLEYGENTFVWTVEEGCAKASDQVTITVDSVSASAGVNQSLCDEDATFLDGQLGSGGQGVWTSSNAAVVIEETDNPKTKVSNLSYGENVFLWTVSFPCGTESDQVVINRFSKPSNVSAGSDIEVCEGDEIQMNASALQAQEEGVWSSLTDGAVFENEEQFDTPLNYDSPGTYFLIWEVVNQACSQVDTVRVDIHRMPVPASAGDDIEVCEGREIFLNADLPTAGIGKWQILEGDADIANLFDPKSRVSFSEGVRTLVWTIENGLCPVIADTVNVSLKKINRGLFESSPNVFTPNGDGKNDFFELFIDEAFENNRLQIFSRDGTKVYERINYKNDWDGGHLPSGVYFYVTQHNGCENAVVKGHFQIVR